MAARCSTCRVRRSNPRVTARKEISADQTLDVGIVEGGADALKAVTSGFGRCQSDGLESFERVHAIKCIDPFCADLAEKTDPTNCARFSG